ncbi:MAG: gas vesicle protein [Chloroflexi bacterium]|nr:gas vesicle protein [Chloroflexota bacterium]
MVVQELAERAKSQLKDITGLMPSAVTEAFKDDLGWHITLEALEMARVPSTADVLGIYEAILDEEGKLLRFQRKRARLRCQTTEE